ncbi:ribonuclease III [Emcibacter sp.]|uniref:ribonuclease III n=1 Tax=Emcibacter sp. TaxID=1979954 RepID=UPI003A9551A3
MTSSKGQYSSLYKTLKYEFRDEDLLRQALTHPSLEGPVSYQRLEFVGDRVLGLLIAEWIYERYPHVDEGGMASRHTNLVRRETCAEAAEKMGLAEYILMAKSTEDTGGRRRATILGDVCEALLGAMYLEGGLDVCRKLIRTHWKDFIDQDGLAVRDAKTRLQEWAQSRKISTPNYVTLGREGPAHEPLFTIAVRLNGMGEQVGQGGSKREAEQAAAARMLEAIEEED